MEVFEDQHQRRLGAQHVEDLGELAQHPGLRSPPGAGAAGAPAPAWAPARATGTSHIGAYRRTTSSTSRRSGLRLKRPQRLQEWEGRFPFPVALGTRPRRDPHPPPSAARRASHRSTTVVLPTRAARPRRSTEPGGRLGPHAGTTTPRCRLRLAPTMGPASSGGATSRSSLTSDPQPCRRTVASSVAWQPRRPTPPESPGHTPQHRVRDMRPRPHVLPHWLWSPGGRDARPDSTASPGTGDARRGAWLPPQLALGHIQRNGPKVREFPGCIASPGLCVNG